MESTLRSDHGFRQHMPDLTTPRFTTMQKQDAREYVKTFLDSGKPPWIHSLCLHWKELLQEPFKGVTNDGVVRPGLFNIQDEQVPMASIVSAAEAVLDAASQHSPPVAEMMKLHIDSHEWRTWSNPEFLLSDKGVRLEDLPETLRDKILALLEATLSPEGYQKAVSAMRTNHFLGELMKTPTILSKDSYNFAFFGKPSTTGPWGFTFYGHHLCLNIFLYRDQMYISPWFTGAEPNLIDQGPYKGTRILHTEEQLGLQLMQSLPSDAQAKAQIYKLLRDPAMPKGRWNHDDQRHLCGAYRDNRIVPYEGILVKDMDAAQQKLVFGIFEQYLLYLPQRSRELRIEAIKEWLHETYFCWIGGFTDEDPFYYRIQSPVIIVEFDHHSGVFLNNIEPQKFHIHTLLRTPNGGDYGMALRPLLPGDIRQEFVWDGERDSWG